MVFYGNRNNKFIQYIDSINSNIRGKSRRLLINMLNSIIIIIMYMWYNVLNMEIQAKFIPEIQGYRLHFTNLWYLHIYYTYHIMTLCKHSSPKIMIIPHYSLPGGKHSISPTYMPDSRPIITSDTKLSHSHLSSYI